MEQLGESYLYAFGWDVKFCDAIEEFFDDQQTKNFQRSKYPPVILHLMRTFYNEDCSKVTFKLLYESKFANFDEISNTRLKVNGVIEGTHIRVSHLVIS